LDILQPARAPMNKFRQDYEIFQLPEPAWIQEAMAEWMDSLDHHARVKEIWLAATVQYWC